MQLPVLLEKPWETNQPTNQLTNLQPIDGHEVSQGSHTSNNITRAWENALEIRKELRSNFPLLIIRPPIPLKHAENNNVQLSSAVSIGVMQLSNGGVIDLVLFLCELGFLNLI